MKAQLKPLVLMMACICSTTLVVHTNAYADEGILNKTEQNNDSITLPTIVVGAAQKTGDSLLEQALLQSNKLKLAQQKDSMMH